jgi:hypothetical protein
LFFQVKNSFRRYIITQRFRKISAILKTGNQSNGIKKSLTHHNRILSIIFQSVHDIRNIAITKEICFLKYSQEKKNNANTAITIEIIALTGIDRETQVFRTGLINNKLSAILRS